MSEVVYTAIDYGSKCGDYTSVAQWSCDSLGNYTLKSIRHHRRHPIRSKAQVKRILKSQSEVLSVNPLRMGRRKDGVEIYPVSWIEIAAHSIEVQP